MNCILSTRLICIQWKFTTPDHRSFAVFFQLLRLRSIGKFGFRFWNPDFGFCNRTRNPKTDFTSEKSVLRVDFNWEIQIRISWISFLPFDWEIRKKICKTVLVNSALLFANYACACKTAVLKNSFSNPFADFPDERQKWKSKNRYISVEIRFRILRSIANPKSGFKNLNPDFPIERTLSSVHLFQSNQRFEAIEFVDRHVSESPKVNLS